MPQITANCDDSYLYTSCYGMLLRLRFFVPIWPLIIPIYFVYKYLTRFITLKFQSPQIMQSMANCFSLFIVLEMTLCKSACSEIIGFFLNQKVFFTFSEQKKLVLLSRCLNSPSICIVISRMMKWLQFAITPYQIQVSIACHSTICLSKRHVVISQINVLQIH